MHATVLYHPSKVEFASLKRIVDRIASREGWDETTWVETCEDDGGTDAVRRAVESGTNLVLAAGGDGTIRSAAEALRGTGVPLGVIPEGTGNLLARNIGLTPHRTEEAVEAAFTGIDHSIDLGVATIVRGDDVEEEHVFLVLAGMGLDARTIRATSSRLKKAVGWLAYIDGGLRTMIQDEPLNIHYSYDDHPTRELKVYTVMIGNCGVLPGGVLLIPDAKIDDGELDVIALRPRGPFSWLNIWNKIAWENGVLRRSKTGRKIINLVQDTKNVVYVRAKTFALSVPKPEPVQLDGDDLGLAVAVKGVVDPGALVIRVAQHWRSSSFVK